MISNCEMRQCIRNGHAQAEFVKATQCDKNIINALVNGNGVTLASVMKFVEAWEKYNVPALISDPEFAKSLARKAPKTRSEKELHWKRTTTYIIFESPFAYEMF